MIHSQLNRFALILILGGTLGLLTLECLLIIDSFGDGQIFNTTKENLAFGVFTTTYMAAYGLLASINILIKLKRITLKLNQKHKIIEIENYFVSTKRQYFFKELDGFILNYGRGSGGGANRTIYLVKNNLKIERINEFTIRNFDEILNGLKRLEDLQSYDHSLIEDIRNIFKFR